MFFLQRSYESERFASWLIKVLDEVVEKSKKRTGVINQGNLWKKYHQLTISESLNVTWKQFLGLCKLDKGPMLYQHVTDELFEMRIKDVVCPSSDDVCSEVTTVTCLTFEEANAVRYIDGYVVHSLKQQKKHEDVFPILEELTDKSPRDGQENEDQPEGPEMEWIKSIDRGGLTRITTDAYQLFYAIELRTRKYFNTDNVKNMDDKFRKHVTNCILRCSI